MKNIFDRRDTDEFIERINRLTPTSKPGWGKMTVDQMLAHLNVAYELVYENVHPRPGALKRLFLRLFVKDFVVGEKPYKKGTPTAPEFRISDERHFETERRRLINYINKTQQLGAAYFDGRQSHSFGTLTKTEWNNMFAKHLEHHLNQFGV